MIQPEDEKFIKMAIEEADRCSKGDPRTPRLAAVLVKNGVEIGKAYRGELDPNQHAEYMLLKRKLKNPADAVGATLYVTLEPCTNRRFHERYDKKCCTEHIIDLNLSRVIIGTLDPNPAITYKGFTALSEAKIEVELFPAVYRRKLEEEINAAFHNLFRPSSIEALADQYLNNESTKKLHEDFENKGREELARRYATRVYSFRGIQTAALQLFGAGAEAYTRKLVHVDFCPTVYCLPSELLERKPKIITVLLEEARKDAAQFFDGPCVRLNRYRFQPTDSTALTNEEKHLWLELGPVGWFDYSIANHWFSKVLLAKLGNGLIRDLNRYVNLDRVAKDGALDTVRLSNIISTATTLMTIDGYVIYSERSSRVSTGQSKLTSAVAESIHQYKDQLQTSHTQDDIPVPFRTVLRGILEELSPKLTRTLNVDAIFLLGIAFDLDVFEPDLLFLAVLPVSLLEFQALYKDYKGVDFHEGEFKFSRALPDEPALINDLSNRDWIPTGQASLIRAVQFVQAICEGSKRSMKEVLKVLSEGRYSELRW